MTQNQIAYWNLKETERSHRANEWLTYLGLGETHRHNVEQESLGWSNLGETERHNKIQELLGFGNLEETMRSNLENERIKWANYGETVRTNKANEAIKAWQTSINEYTAFENARHNAVTEELSAKSLEVTAQHYQRQDTISAKEVGIKQYAAETARMEAETHQGQLAEKTTFDTASLALQGYSNKLREYELGLKHSYQTWEMDYRDKQLQLNAADVIMGHMERQESNDIEWFKGISNFSLGILNLPISAFKAVSGANSD